MKKYGFTLLELIVVIIIIGILVGLAIFGYRGMRESGLNQEAIANLKLIQAAERTYRMEFANYTNCGNIAACNSILRLSLPVGNATTCAGRSWHYNVSDASDTNYAAQARRCGTDDRRWVINATQDEPICEDLQGRGYCK